MKKLLILLIMTCVTAGAFAEKNEEDLRLYAGVGGAQLDGEAVVTLDLKLAYAALSWLDIGVQASAYHTLEREYKDADGNVYQAESGFMGLYVQPHWQLNKRLDVGVKLASGMQLIQLRYAGDLRDTLVYYEEYPDKINVPYSDLGLTLEYSLCPDHSLQLEAGYRNAHPSESPYLEHKVEGTVYGGIFYGIKLN